MLKFLITLLTASFFSYNSTAGDNDLILRFLQEKSEISIGGTAIYELNGLYKIITVSSVVVESKDVLTCQKVALGKAKRDMISYVNGSEITSYTELKISEELISAKEEKYKFTQTYTEEIKEKVMSSINQITPVGGWFSDDKSVYYYAVYKNIEY